MHNTRLPPAHPRTVVPTARQDVDDVFAKYDPKGTGSLDVHKFVLRIISPSAQPEPWFRDRATYEFHVLNRAPMKKVERGGLRWFSCLCGWLGQRRRGLRWDGAGRGGGVTLGCGGQVQVPISTFASVYQVSFFYGWFCLRLLSSWLLVCLVELFTGSDEGGVLEENTVDVSAV